MYYLYSECQENLPIQKIKETPEIEFSKIIKKIEKNIFFKKKKTNCVFFSIIEQLKKKNYKLAISIFNKLLSENYDFNEKNYLGHSFILLLTKYLHDKISINDKTSINVKHIIDLKKVVLPIIYQLMKLKLGFEDEQQGSSIKNHISSKYTENILNFSIEACNLELVKIIIDFLNKLFSDDHSLFEKTK